MPFRRRRFAAQQKLDKHEITWSLLAADMSSNTTVEMILGVAVEDKGSSIECAVGSHVSSIYVEMNIAAETVTNPKVLHWIMEGSVFGQSGVGNPNEYYQEERAQIFKRGMEMLPKDVGTVYKRVFVVRIPKKYQRIAMGNKIRIKFKCSSAEAINVCGFAIYKERY